MKKHICIFFGVLFLLFPAHSLSAHPLNARSIPSAVRYEKTPSAQPEFAAKKDKKKKGKKDGKESTRKNAAARGSSSFNGREAGFAKDGSDLLRCIGTDSYWAVCITDVNGNVLLDEQADKVTYPSDATRLMLFLLAVEQLERGLLKPAETLTVSLNAVQTVGASVPRFQSGDTLTVDEALKFLVLRPCTQVEVALAERLGRSAEAVIGQMNARARQLGMSKTKFLDFTGTDGALRPDLKQIATTTARDMAILGREVLKHPIARERMKLAEWKTNLGLPKTKTLTNLITALSKRPIPGCVGIWGGGSMNSSGVCGVYAFVRNKKVYIVSMWGAGSRKGLEQWVSTLLDKIAPPPAGSNP